MCHIVNAFCNQLKRLVETYKSTQVRMDCNIVTVRFITYNMIMYLNASDADLSFSILFFSHLARYQNIMVFMKLIQLKSKDKNYISYIILRRAMLHFLVSP